MVEQILAEVNYADRKTALTQKQRTHKKQFQPSLSRLKNMLIQELPLLREILKEPPWFLSEKSLKDMIDLHNGHTAGVALVCEPNFNNEQKTTTKFINRKGSGFKIYSTRQDRKEPIIYLLMFSREVRHL